MLSIVVLAYNEADNLRPTVEEALAWLDRLEGRPEGVWPAEATADMPEGTPAGELILVDDGSTDGTGTLADVLAEKDSRVRSLHHDHNRGMGAVLRTGYAAARGRYVSQLPADGQVPPHTLEAHLPHLDDVDLVLAVYRARDDGARRALMSRTFQGIVRALYGHDPRITGTMIVRRSLLELFPIVADTFFANLELPFRLLRAGVPHRVVEIEAAQRRSGRSKVANLPRIARVVREMAFIRLRHWR